MGCLDACERFCCCVFFLVFIPLYSVSRYSCVLSRIHVLFFSIAYCLLFLPYVCLFFFIVVRACVCSSCFLFIFPLPSWSGSGVGRWFEADSSCIDLCLLLAFLCCLMCFSSSFGFYLSYFSPWRFSFVCSHVISFLCFQGSHSARPANEKKRKSYKLHYSWYVREDSTLLPSLSLSFPP